MSDATSRDLERRWRAEPANRTLLAQAIEARRRDGLPVPFDLVIAQDRWRPLARFVERWHGRALEEKDGVADERLEPWLPLVVRELYRILGARPDLFCLNARSTYHDTTRTALATPEELTRTGSHLWLLRHGENLRWGVRADEIHEADPPITLERGSGSPHAQRSVESPLTSEFFLHLLQLQMLLTPVERVDFQALGTIDLELVGRVRGALPPLTRRPWHWPGPSSELLGDDETLLLLEEEAPVEDGARVFVTALTGRAFAAAHASLERAGLRFSSISLAGRAVLAHPPG